MSAKLMLILFGLLPWGLLLCGALRTWVAEDDKAGFWLTILLLKWGFWGAAWSSLCLLGAAML